MGLFARLFGRKKELTEEFYDELTEQLIASDMGVMLAEDIIDELRDRAKHDKIKKADDCRELLKDILIEHLPENDIEYKYRHTSFKNNKFVFKDTGSGEIKTFIQDDEF